MSAVKDATTGFGVIRYNGYEFGPLRKATIEIRNVTDDADVTVIYSTYVLRVQAIVHATTTDETQAKQATLQAALNKAGGRLEIQDIGFFTDIDTAAGGVTPEVAGGPRPRVISAKPIGGDLSWEVIWAVEFSLNPCAQGGNVFSAFNWDVFYSIDDRGFTTRRISGYFEIAQNRNSGGTIGTTHTKNLETFWDNVEFTIPFAFKRLTNDRHYTADRRRCDFLIVDEELRDKVYPEGIVAADVDYDFENIPPGFIRWNATLAGTMEVAPGYSNSIAGQKFFLILFDRLAKLRASAEAQGGLVLPQRIRFGTKLFRRESRFAVSFMLVACLDDLVGRSGVWSQLEGDYTTWKASLDAVGIWGKRGRYQLRHNLSDDVIVDLCSGTSQLSIGNDTGNLQNIDGEFTASMSCVAVTAERSWLSYRNRIRVIAEQKGNVHVPTQHWEGIDLNSTPVQVGQELLIGMGVPRRQQSRELILQYEGPSEDLIVMQGDSLRLNLASDIPKLISVGGVEVEQLSQNVDSEPIANFFGCPVYLTRWAILYRAKGPIAKFEPSKNKTLCVTKGQDDGRQ